MDWNRKNKIEFFNNDPNIIDNYPIIEAKNQKLKWVKKTREDFDELVKKGAGDIPGFSHLVRCPGIFDLFKYGYIISLHKDLLIRPKGKGFEWMLPPDESQMHPETYSEGALKISSQADVATNMLSRPPWSAEFIVKIQTGWHVIAPKGVKFLVLPIAYPDTFEFTSTIGILNPAIDTAIVLQMFWNATEPETIIRAGTPLGHLVPLTEKKYQMVQRTMNQQDHDWVVKAEHAQYSTSFWRYTMRGKVVAMYNKYWKR